MRNPMNPSPSTQRRSSRTAFIGLARFTAARPAKRPGCFAIQSATSSLAIKGPSGACHALSRPNEIPAASIAAIVTSIGSSSAGSSCPVQRRSDSNISCRRKRNVGCCIQTSIVMAGILTGFGARVTALAFARAIVLFRQAQSLDDPRVVARNESGRLSDLPETQWRLLRGGFLGSRESIGCPSIRSNRRIQREAAETLGDVCRCR